MLLDQCRMSTIVVILCCLVSGCATTACIPDVVQVVPTMTWPEKEGHVLQAEQYIAARNYPLAIIHYESVVEAYPYEALAWFRLGTVYLRTEQVFQAQKAFERTLILDPDLKKAQANLALIYLKQFRVAALQAVDSNQISDANKAALNSLLRDVDHALPPVAVVSSAETK
jgi:Tfp pilus assembly protein PilF